MNNISNIEPPKEFTSIFNVGGHFAAVYINDNSGETTFISEPKADIRIAKLSAMCFSKENKIAYIDQRLNPTATIMGIVKSNGEFYPAEFYGNSVWFNKDEACTEDKVVEKAEKLAAQFNYDFIPYIFRSLD